MSRVAICNIFTEQKKQTNGLYWAATAPAPPEAAAAWALGYDRGAPCYAFYTCEFLLALVCLSHSCPSGRSLQPS